MPLDLIVEKKLLWRIRPVSTPTHIPPYSHLPQSPKHKQPKTHTRKRQRQRIVVTYAIQCSM